jgi:hypothetical protein
MMNVSFHFFLFELSYYCLTEKLAFDDLRLDLAQMRPAGRIRRALGRAVWYVHIRHQEQRNASVENFKSLILCLRL